MSRDRGVLRAERETEGKLPRTSEETKRNLLLMTGFWPQSSTGRWLISLQTHTRVKGHWSASLSTLILELSCSKSSDRSLRFQGNAPKEVFPLGLYDNFPFLSYSLLQFNHLPNSNLEVWDGTLNYRFLTNSQASLGVCNKLLIPAEYFERLGQNKNAGALV